jgi:integrase
LAVRRIGVPEELKAELQREALKRGWPMGATDHVVPMGQQAPGHIVVGDKGWFGDHEKGSRGFVHLGRYMKSHGWTRRQKGHELRKIFATRVNMFNNTIDVMNALGHKDIKTTKRYVMPSTPKPVMYDYGSKTQTAAEA